MVGYIFRMYCMLGAEHIEVVMPHMHVSLLGRELSISSLANQTPPAWHHHGYGRRVGSTLRKTNALYITIAAYSWLLI